VAALRTDQAGRSTFSEFLAACWRAGVVRYDVDFAARSVAYYGCRDEVYTESYPAVEIERVERGVRLWVESQNEVPASQEVSGLA